MLDLRPELLHRFAKERHQRLLQEAHQERMLRRHRPSSFHRSLERLAHRLGGLLCAAGARLQNRQVL